MEESIREEIDDAVAYADTSPMPEGAAAIEGVYCGPDCWWEKTLVAGDPSSAATDD